MPSPPFQGHSSNSYACSLRGVSLRELVRLDYRAIGLEETSESIKSCDFSNVFLAEENIQSLIVRRLKQELVEYPEYIPLSPPQRSPAEIPGAPKALVGWV